MLIDMVHGTFFQKFSQKWQVTNWVVVGRDEIQGGLFQERPDDWSLPSGCKDTSLNEILTRLDMVGRILSMHSFRSLAGRMSNLHDLVYILKMIFLTSVWVNSLNLVRLGIFFLISWYTGFSVRLSLIFWILFINKSANSLVRSLTFVWPISVFTSLYNSFLSPLQSLTCAL